MRQRNTARAVLLDPENRILLFEFVIPKDYIQGTPKRFWATPGGEIEPGEDVRAAVAREIHEETGMEDVEIGPELWFGSNQFVVNGEPTKTLERFFLARTAVTQINTANWTEIEKKIMRQHRWWTAAELVAAADTIFPPRFGQLVERFLRVGTNGPEEIPL